MLAGKLSWMHFRIGDLCNGDYNNNRVAPLCLTNRGPIALFAYTPVSAQAMGTT